MNPSYFLHALSLLDRVSQAAYMKAATRALKLCGVEVIGEPLWVSPRIYWDVASPGDIVLGARCVISHDVKLLTHDYSLDRVLEGQQGISDTEVKYSAPITIGDRAFIGMGATILPGITIGQGAIVGAGSVVTRDIEGETVWAGNPARYICTTQDYLKRKLKTTTSVPRRR